MFQDLPTKLPDFNSDDCACSGVSEGGCHPDATTTTQEPNADTAIVLHKTTFIVASCASDPKETIK